MTQALKIKRLRLYYDLIYEKLQKIIITISIML